MNNVLDIVASEDNFEEDIDNILGKFPSYDQVVLVDYFWDNLGFHLLIVQEDIKSKIKNGLYE